MEAGTKTTVDVTASGYDDRPGQSGDNVGCGEDGCLPDLAHDGIGEEDVESRWSCAEDIVPHGGQCEIEFTFGSPQNIVDVQVAFWKGDERTRTLKVCWCCWWFALGTASLAALRVLLVVAVISEVLHFVCGAVLVDLLWSLSAVNASQHCLFIVFFYPE